MCVGTPEPVTSKNFKLNSLSFKLTKKPVASKYTTLMCVAVICSFWDAYFQSVCVYREGSKKDQIEALRKGVEIVVATPERVIDLIDAGHLKLEAITYLVLDEADQMLDVGFELLIRKTLLDIRPDRQTVMMSARWPTEVQQLAKSYMKNPIAVHVSSLDLADHRAVSRAAMEVCVDVYESRMLL